MAKERITSAVANKLLRQLQDDKDYWLSLEDDSSTYIRVVGYDDEEAPVYDYCAVRDEVARIDEEICKIKHAINQFNCSIMLPNVELTLDSALIEMAQLNKKKDRLDRMRKRLPSQRVKHSYGESSNLVEYNCVNYDIELAKKDYDKVCERIRAIQTDIDYINQTEKFEINI